MDEGGEVMGKWVQYRNERPSKRRLATHKTRREESMIDCRGFWEGCQCDTCLGEEVIEEEFVDE